jgi:hypothetical protein
MEKLDLMTFFQKKYRIGGGLEIIADLALKPLSKFNLSSSLCHNPI